MTLCFVVRLLPDHLSESQIVGRVEIVETGERATFKDANELITFMRHSARGSNSRQVNP